jgi:hypothetical protein
MALLPLWIARAALIEIAGTTIARPQAQPNHSGGTDANLQVRRARP